MIREKVKSQWYCVKCGGSHPAKACVRRQAGPDLPLETPSHNGQYRGTVAVRTIPPAVFGTNDMGLTDRIKAKIGNAIQQRSRALKPCRACGKILSMKANERVNGFCSYPCRDEFYREANRRRDALRRVSHRKTKWERD